MMWDILRKVLKSFSYLMIWVFSEGEKKTNFASHEWMLWVGVKENTALHQTASERQVKVRVNHT